METDPVHSGVEPVHASGPGDSAIGAGIQPVDRRAFLRSAAGVAVAATTSGGLLAGCGSAPSASKTSSGAATHAIAVSKYPTALYNPSLPAGPRPTQLPRRLACSLPADAEIFTSFSNAIAEGAKAANLDFIVAQANGDTTTQHQQIQTLMSRGICGLIAFDNAPPALAPLQLQAIQKGIPFMTGPFQPSTVQISVEQYEIGVLQAKAALRWIKTQLNGEAQVVLFNWDNGPGVKARGDGIRATLKSAGGGIRLVEDITPSATSPDVGYRDANQILQVHPDVNVWLGSDSVLEGVLSALKAAGKSGAANIGLFGSDGDAQALSAIDGGGLFKATVGYSPLSIVGYAYAQWAAAWLEGKSIPLVVSLPAILLDTKEKIAAYNRAAPQPAGGYQANLTQHNYFRPLGNTSFGDNRYLTVTS